MIKEVAEKDIAECVKVIRESFSTVAIEFGFTVENAPRFTAFATTEERLEGNLTKEHKLMYAFWEKETIVGYYSLLLQENKACELNNLCVMPAYRHNGIGEELLRDAFKAAGALYCITLNTA